ncbi:hypothetical protein [Methylomonas sp. LWB]|uniref:hypothetical protein n=1 Tax=Methylomonas sp. LWB TaxID=1905845 RepID=UPI0034A20498
MCWKGYRVNQLTDIFAVYRDTVSGWITAREQEGLMGQRDPDIQDGLAGLRKRKWCA